MSSRKRIRVIPGSYDDIASVLKSLDLKHEIMSDNGVLTPAVLDSTDILFVACSAEPQCNPSDVRNFVSKGGALYISDLSSSFLEKVFPEKAQFGIVEYDENVEVDIKDPGLMEIVGRSVKLHMNITSAMGIQSVSSDVQILMEGYQRKANKKQKFPYLISFYYGDGQVIYTVFHNSQQTSSIEQKLLNYLVFRPLLVQQARAAAKLAEIQMADLGKEIFSSVNKNQLSHSFGAKLSLGSTGIFVLSWEESEKLSLKIKDPQNKVVSSQISNKSPVVIETPITEAGLWSCEIEALQAQSKNIPFVLTIASRKGVSSKVTNLTSQKGQNAPDVLGQDLLSRSKKTLSVYFVIDTSIHSQKYLPFLKGGVQHYISTLSKMIKPGIKGIIHIYQSSAPEYVNRISVDRVSNQVVVLNNGTHSNLGTTLNKVLADINENIEEGSKPLVIIILSSDPSDEWNDVSGKLVELATNSKINVFVIGIGPYRNIEVLKKLAKHPPLGLPEVLPGTIRETFDWFLSITEVILQGFGTEQSQRKVVPPPPSCLDKIK